MSERYRLFELNLNAETQHYEIYSNYDARIIAVFNINYKDEAHAFFNILVNNMIKAHSYGA